MAYYTSKGIILKGMDYREGDKIVTVFSEEKGKIKAIARGVKKPRSSLRACVQTFCYSFFHFSQGKELDLITQGKILDFYGNIREDLQKALQVIYIIEIIDQITMEKMPLPGLYNGLRELLEYLNEKPFNPLSIRYMEMHILAELGFKPQFQQCVVCGRNDRAFNYISIAGGGMVCADCGGRREEDFELTGESWGLLRLISQTQWPLLDRIRASQQALVQMELFMEKYMEYHLEKRFKMKDTIRKIKKLMR